MSRRPLIDLTHDHHFLGKTPRQRTLCEQAGTMTTFDDVGKLIKETYDSTWRSWYAGAPGETPSTLEVRLGACSSGYLKSSDTILIYVASGNINNRDVEDAEGWPLWKCELIHEMLHEYQYKMVTAPSEPGTQLWLKYKDSFQSFPGKGHGADFYTAMVSVSSLMGVSPEQLFDKL